MDQNPSRVISAGEPELPSLPGADPLTPTIFHARWWLDATSGGDYYEAEVRSDSRLIARMPYAIVSHFPMMTLCCAPQLCHSLGPAIDLGRGSHATRSLKHFQITQELIGQIHPSGGFHMALHSGIKDTFAFTEAGFNTQVQFTFEIAPQPEEAIWLGMRDKTRNVIRRAQERWHVVALDDPAEFASVYDVNVRSRGMTNFYDRIVPVCAAAISRDVGRILAVRGSDGDILGAIFVVWDRRAMYYLMATRTIKSDNSVMSLLVWNAIRLAAANGLTFDFDNVGTPGSRLFFSGFGGIVAPRFVVMRRNTPFRVGHLIRRLARAVKRDPAGLLRRGSLSLSGTLGGHTQDGAEIAGGDFQHGSIIRDH